MIHVDSLSELKAKGTIADDSLPSFIKYFERDFSGKPVEFCWNDQTSSMDKKGNIVYKRMFTFRDYLCMRPFSSNHNNPTDALMMKITNAEGRPKIVKRFYDYLLGKESPWSAAIPALALVGEQHGGIPRAVVWFDTSNTCAKLTMNLLTAMRLHTCWGLDYVWARLVDAGFHPDYALLLATNFSWGGQDLTVSNGPDGKFDENPFEKVSLSKLGCSKTDMPFSTNYNPSGFRPFFDHKPSHSGKSLAEKTSVQPNNFIWHGDGVEVNADNLNKGSHEYKTSKIKVVPKLEALASAIKGKALPLAFVQDIEHKLYNNEMVEV